MSFNWSDEEMEVNEEENDENKKLDLETINELAKQYEVSKKELDRLNQIGVEVRYLSLNVIIVILFGRSKERSNFVRKWKCVQ